MKPSTLSAVLSAAWRAFAPPYLIVGRPGVGKTSIIEQAARELGAPLFVSHPAVEDPTDVKGFPFPSPDGTHARFLPFGVPAQILAAAQDAERVIWFVDDLGQASEAVQKAYMQLFLARMLGEYALPANVIFVAATNDRTHKAGVHLILEPVKSRFGSIIHLSADLSDWCAWAVAAGLPAELIAFLRLHPALLDAFEPTADIRNSPSPRTWAAFAKILSNPDIPAVARPELLSGAVGEAAATQFLAFGRMYREIPTVDAILLNPDTADLPDSVSVLNCVVTGLAFRASEQNFARVARYASRMYNSGQHGDYAALLVRDSVRRVPEIANTPAFVHLMSSDFGELLTGESY